MDIKSFNQQVQETLKADSKLVPLFIPSEYDLKEFLTYLHKDEYAYEEGAKRIYVQKDDDEVFIFSTDDDGKIVDLVIHFQIKGDIRIWEQTKITVVREFPFDDFQSVLTDYFDSKYGDQYSLRDLSKEYLIKTENPEENTPVQNHYIYKVENDQIKLEEIIKYYDTSVDEFGMF